MKHVLSKVGLLSDPITVSPLLCSVKAGLSLEFPFPGCSVSWVTVGRRWQKTGEQQERNTQGVSPPALSWEALSGVADFFVPPS